MKNHVEQALKLRKWVSIGHHIPGRIRLKYKLGIVTQLARYKSNDIEKAIALLPAIKSYKLNKVTGTILMEYDKTLIDPALIAALFSESEMDAERAYYTLAETLNLTGE